MSKKLWPVWIIAFGVLALGEVAVARDRIPTLKEMVTWRDPPIRIDGDEELRRYIKKLYGNKKIIGDGSAKHPFVIKKLKIVGINPQTAIEELLSGKMPQGQGNGIILENIRNTHVVFDNIKVGSCVGNGIVVKNSSHITFTNTEVAYTFGWFGSFPAHNGFPSTGVYVENSHNINFDRSVRISNVYAGAAAAGAPIPGLLQNGGDGAVACGALITGGSNNTMNAKIWKIWGSAGGAEAFHIGVLSRLAGTAFIGEDGGPAIAFAGRDTPGLTLGADIREVKSGAGGAGGAGMVGGGNGGRGAVARGAYLLNIPDLKVVGLKVVWVDGSTAGAAGAATRALGIGGSGADGGDAIALQLVNCDVDLLDELEFRKLRGAAGSTAAINMEFVAQKSAPSGKGGGAFGLVLEHSRVRQVGRMKFDYFTAGAGAAGVLASLKIPTWDNPFIMTPGGKAGDGGNILRFLIDDTTWLSPQAAQGIAEASKKPFRISVRGLGGLNGLGMGFFNQPIAKPGLVSNIGNGTYSYIRGGLALKSHQEAPTAKFPITDRAVAEKNPYNPPPQINSAWGVSPRGPELQRACVRWWLSLFFNIKK